MKAIRKYLLVALVTLMSVCCAIGFAACNDPETTNYTLTYVSGADDATGTVEAEQYAEGASVTLKSADVFAREGYTFANWSDGTNTYAAGATFTMPAQNVTMTALWTENQGEEPSEPTTLFTKQLESVPSSDMTVTATANNLTATANYFVAYGENGLEFTIYVTDESLKTTGSTVYTNDGVEVYISKVQRVSGYSEGAIGVAVDAIGNVSVKDLYNNTVLTDTNVTASAEVFTIDGETDAGYIVTITVPYDKTEVTKADKDAAICFGLTNYTSVKSYTAYNEDYKNVYTWTAVTADNTFETNPNHEFSVVWGDGADCSLTASSAWNLYGDDGSDGASIYMTSVDGADNYIYMKDSNATKSYSEVKISTLALYNSEKWAKFGFVVFTNDKAGFAFYIDAPSSNGTDLDSSTLSLGINTHTANGWDNSWTEIKILTGSYESYTDGNYVTLGVYRQGSVFKLYANDTCIYTYTCSSIGTETDAYVGLFSFNTTLTVKDFFTTTDQGEFPEGAEVTAESVDYLVIGSSYVTNSSSYWYTYSDLFDSKSAANMAVPGTLISYWEGQLSTVETLYVPKNIIMHIGPNDVNAGADAATTIANLKAFFTNLHTTFPDANVYWSSFVRNMAYTENWGTYKTINETMQTWANESENGWFNYVDMWSVISPDDNGTTYQWFSGDELHYNANGYAAFDKVICETLNITRTESNTTSGLGDVTVEGAPSYAYTTGWEFDSNGTAHQAGTANAATGAEQQIFISGLYAADFYAQVEISVAGLYSSDSWAKTGLAVQTATATYFFFIDCNAGKNTDGYYGYNYGNLAYRSHTSESWTWEVYGNTNYFYLGNNSYDYAKDGSFKTLGIAKVGSTLYLFADNTLLKTWDSELGETEKAVVSVMTFNMNVYAKNATYTTDSTEIQAKIAGDSSITVDGSKSDWTSAQLSNPYEIPVSGGKSVTIYATTAEDGIYVFYDAYHASYVDTDADSWWLNTNIEFRIGSGATQYYASAYGQSNGLANFKFVTSYNETTQLYHTCVEAYINWTQAAADGCSYSANGYVAMGFAWKTGGETGQAWSDNNDYWYGVEADPTTRLVYATVNGIQTGTEKTIDGDISDWSSETFVSATTNETDTTASAKYSAYIGSDGVYLCVVIEREDIDISATYTGGSWWLDTNLEFFDTDNFYASRIITYGGKVYHSGRFTDVAVSLTEGESVDTLVFEIFIANASLNNYTAGETTSITLNFGGQLYGADDGSRASNWQDYARGFTVTTKTTSTDSDD